MPPIDKYIAGSSSSKNKIHTRYLNILQHPNELVAESNRTSAGGITAQATENKKLLSFASSERGAGGRQRPAIASHISSYYRYGQNSNYDATVLPHQCVARIICFVDNMGRGAQATRARESKPNTFLSMR